MYRFLCGPVITGNENRNEDSTAMAKDKASKVVPGTVLPTIAQVGANAPMPNSNDSASLSGKPLKLFENSVKNPFKKAIMGDVFGTQRLNGDSNRSMLGMMYRARVQENLLLNRNNKSHLDDKGDNDDDALAGESTEIDITESDNESDDAVQESMNPRQQLASTIRNWSVTPENDGYIIAEGAVHALIALAGLEDNHVKKCVVSALYHLSLRPHNRQSLLHLGAATGVITISMNVNRWKIAKLCALTLRNLSMENNGETVIAKEGGILSLVILAGLKGHRLVPLCAQGLYNLTCVEEHYKGIERVMKALLNLPVTSFDCTRYILRALVNCSRYSWLRLRMIEDGALNAISGVLSTLNQKENKEELTMYILQCLRALSESIGCRGELLAKGVMDLVFQIETICGDYRSFMYIVKVVHNLLSMPNINKNSFELAVSIVCDVIEKSSVDQIVVLQYSAACVSIFTKAQMRGNSSLASKVMVSLNKLVFVQDALTQYYSISSAGFLFFAKSFTGIPSTIIDKLVTSFIEVGPVVAEPTAKQALALSIAKLSQEDSYMEILSRLDLLYPVIDLLVNLLKSRHDDDKSTLIQECMGSAVCRIVLHLSDDIDVTIKETISSCYIDIISSSTSPSVLTIAVGAIRIFGELGIIHEEFLSDNLLLSIARIAIEHKSNIELSRLCCSVLAVFSYDEKSHNVLCTESVLDILFENTKAEDAIIRELVATTLCNISISHNAASHLVSKGVVEVLATLSGGTSEFIQELCAKCICNITSSVSEHKKILESNILHTILMISLVRSVGTDTKCLCAKSLVNLIREENMTYLRTTGVIRVFAALALLPDKNAQYICAKGYMLYSQNEQRVEDVIQRNGAIQSLLSLVKSSSAKTRVIVGLVICNLLTYTIAQASVLAMGGLSVLKIIATIDHDELREATARIIINISHNKALLPLLSKEPIISVLLYTLSKTENAYTYECSLCALCCLAHQEELRRTMVDADTIPCIVQSIISGKINTVKIASEVIRCFCLLSFECDKAKLMLSGNMITGFWVLLKSNLTTKESRAMIIVTIRNMSAEKSIRNKVVHDGAYKLLTTLLDQFEAEISLLSLRATIVTFYNLVQEANIHSVLVTKGIVNNINCIALKQGKNIPGQNGGLFYTQTDIEFITKAINLLASSEVTREVIVQSNLIEIFAVFIDGVNEVSMFEIASAMAKVSSSKQCKEMLVDQGAPELLIHISTTTASLETQSKCSLALGYLSEITKVHQGTVSALLMLSLKKEDSHSDTTDETPIESNGPSKSSNATRRETISTSVAPVRSLKSMLHDGLLGTVKLHQLKNDNSRYSLSKFKAKVSPGTFHIGRHTPKDAEIHSLSGEYTKYMYEIKILPIVSEDCGSSPPLRVNLPLPQVADNRQIDTSDATPPGIAVGSQVQRGKDWPIGNEEDGGENNYGLVWAVNELGSVTVQWPNGKQVNYKYGKQEGQSGNKFYQEVSPIDRNAELSVIFTEKKACPKDTAMENDTTTVICTAETVNTIESEDAVAAKSLDQLTINGTESHDHKRLTAKFMRKTIDDNEGSKKIKRHTVAVVSRSETMTPVNASELPGAAWK